MINILDNADLLITSRGKLGKGLSFYSQKNNHFEWTEKGIHWIRDPNITNGGWGGNKTTFGGISILMSPVLKYLIEGHTYVLAMDVDGTMDTNSFYFRFSYNYGWEGDDSLMPKPTVLYQKKPELSNDNTTVYYIFTISDTIYKTAQVSFSSIEAGKEYLSYKSFVLGYGYSNNTGSGTNLYIKDLRLYDLAEYDGTKIYSNGQFKDLCFSDATDEQFPVQQLRYNGVSEF